MWKTWTSKTTNQRAAALSRKLDIENGLARAKKHFARALR
jgi:hypothetical protein